MYRDPNAWAAPVLTTIAVILLAAGLYSVLRDVSFWRPNLGFALIGIAAVLAIFARLAQAGCHHRELMHRQFGIGVNNPPGE